MSFKLFRRIPEENEQEPKESKEHQSMSDPLNIGNIMIRMGALSQDALEAAVAEQITKRTKGSNVLLGQILVERGAVTIDQLDEALKYQCKAHLPDSSMVHSAMDKLDKALKKSERRTQEMKAVTHTAMIAAKITN